MLNNLLFAHYAAWGLLSPPVTGYGHLLVENAESHDVSRHQQPSAYLHRVGVLEDAEIGIDGAHHCYIHFSSVVFYYL